MKLSVEQQDALRALCLQVIERGGEGPVARAFEVPLVIPLPGEPWDRTITLCVSAMPSDFKERDK